MGLVSGDIIKNLRISLCIWDVAGTILGLVLNTSKTVVMLFGKITPDEFREEMRAVGFLGLEVIVSRCEEHLGVYLGHDCRARTWA